MSISIVAERTRRDWHNWASEHLATYGGYSVSDERQKVKALKTWKRDHGPARSYEAGGIDTEQVLRAVSEVVALMGFSELMVLVGHPEAPALFRIEPSDLELVLRRGMELDVVVGIVPAEGHEMLAIDFPSPEQTALISAEGAWERGVGILASFLPGGHEFTGN